jgi:hypothetical protein
MEFMAFSILLSVCFGYFVALMMAGEDPNCSPDEFWKSSYFWVTILVSALVGIFVGGFINGL